LAGTYGMGEQCVLMDFGVCSWPRKVYMWAQETIGMKPKSLPVPIDATTAPNPNIKEDI